MAQSLPVPDERLEETIWGIKACEEAVLQLARDHGSPQAAERIEHVRAQLLMELATQRHDASPN